MEEKKQLKQDQLWLAMMTVLPVVILINASGEITDNAGMKLLYSGILGAIGGVIGYFGYHFTKDRSQTIKILTIILLVTISGLTVYAFSSQPTDNELLEQDWITQKIGTVEFDSPTELQLQVDIVPDSMKWFYSEMKVYWDERSDRITSFMQTRILVDTLLIEDAYLGALEGLLQKIEIPMDEVDLEIFGADEEEISAMFSFELKSEKVHGYGFMYKKGKLLESIWLMPIQRGFSREYIEEFDAGIFPD